MTPTLLAHVAADGTVRVRRVASSAAAIQARRDTFDRGGTSDNIPIRSDTVRRGSMLQFAMNTAARLEHVQSIQTALLCAVLDDMRPEDRRQTLERFTAMARDLEPVDNDNDNADAAGAAWCAALLAGGRR